MSKPARVAVVTGANKGIGLAIVRQLCLQYPSSPFNNGPFLVYLTARDKSRGEAALSEIQSDAQLHKAKALAQDGGLATIKFRQLDIASEDSIKDLAEFLKKEHGGIDMLINNAGIAMQGFDNNVVKNTLAINYYGTLSLTTTLLPLLNPGGRLINVSSMAGTLHKYPPSLRTSFHRAASDSPSAITSLMQSFASAVADGTHTAQGWPSAAYAVSKAGVTGMTMAVAKQAREEGKGVLVNACCPGYVRTDMTRGGGVKTVDQGAMTPVMLALGDIGGRTGEYWQDEVVKEW